MKPSVWNNPFKVLLILRENFIGMGNFPWASIVVTDFDRNSADEKIMKTCDANFSVANQCGFCSTGCASGRVVDVALVIDGSGSIRDSMSQDNPGVNNWDLLKIFLEQARTQLNSLAFRQKKKEAKNVLRWIVSFCFPHAVHGCTEHLSQRSQGWSRSLFQSGQTSVHLGHIHEQGRCKGRFPWDAIPRRSD